MHNGTSCTHILCDVCLVPILNRQYTIYHTSHEKMMLHHNDYQNPVVKRIHLLTEKNEINAICSHKMYIR